MPDGAAGVGDGPAEAGGRGPVRGEQQFQVGVRAGPAGKAGATGQPPQRVGDGGRRPAVEFGGEGERPERCADGGCGRGHPLAGGVRQQLDAHRPRSARGGRAGSGLTAGQR
ncbi:hypothetical protein KCH_09680 [Kitasatospora cheerisanensis KCTC 2395]|uniref:Uncharacterized protein n=1 Tax=Kitasatospora cheerisanensis KCTC 2395 TaxID=1348663 RepID=A0A066ZAC6_9ACTN|nr:hypothetical protein KCH_09680 [Kitasatospora cheerisanensis KCTC 2395]